MTNYEKGVRLERELVNEARKAGFFAIRSAGSHSPIDVIVIQPSPNCVVELIQVKKGKQKADFSGLPKNMPSIASISITTARKIKGKWEFEQVKEGKEK